MLTNLEIVNYYKNNISSIKISKIDGRSSQTIINILRKENIIIKPNKFNFNEDYFEKIDTEDKDYFLGLLMADGNVYKNKLQIELIDLDIIIKLKKFIDFSGNIHTKNYPNRSKTYSITFTSNKLVDDLSKYGIIPAKTHKTYFPDIPEEFHSHFIRGVFDGDGCIYYSLGKQPIFSIVGNTALITKIQEILVEKCNIKKNKVIHSKTSPLNIISIAWKSSKNLIKIKNWLYKDATVYLQRKYDKFQLIKISNFNRECIKCKRIDKVIKHLCKKCYGKEYKKYTNKLKRIK